MLDNAYTHTQSGRDREKKTSHTNCVCVWFKGEIQIAYKITIVHVIKAQ